MFNFVPPTIPHNVFVIGAGGTGSRLIPLLSQFLRSISHGRTPTGWIRDPNVFLIDDDVLEQKNILRQNFIEPDVGKYKATVLAERYSRAYGVNIVPLIERVTTANAKNLQTKITEVLNTITNTKVDLPTIFDNSIVIICVDSVEARRDILNTFIMKGSVRKAFFIDAGNEDNFGQVSFFTPDIIYEDDLPYDKWNNISKLPKLIPVSVDVDYMPMDFNYYKNLIDTPAQGSCADLNQTLAINAIMATTVMGIVQNYYYRKKMSYNTVSISLDGASYTSHNTFNNFKSKALENSMTAVNTKKGTTTSVEKNGDIKTLSFPSNCNFHSVSELAKGLHDEIKVKEIEAAKVRMAAEAEERAKAKLLDKEKKAVEAAASLLAAEKYQQEVLASLGNVTGAFVPAPTYVSAPAPAPASIAEAVAHNTLDPNEVILPIAPVSPTGRRRRSAAVPASQVVQVVELEDPYRATIQQAMTALATVGIAAGAADVFVESVAPAPELQPVRRTRTSVVLDVPTTWTPEQTAEIARIESARADEGTGETVEQREEEEEEDFAEDLDDEF